MQSPTIEYRPLEELRLDEGNPKLHDLAAIKESIRRFGFVSPIIVNEATGSILAGHGRVTALREMCADGEPMPGRIKEWADGWEVPVLAGVSFESDEEARAYLVADNRLTELGGWDHGALFAILREINLEGTGYDDRDLLSLGRLFGEANLLGDDDGVIPSPGTPPDEFPTVDESISTEYRCPQCSYEWSGKPK